MDHLTGMAVFAKVVEAGTFTAAARDLGLSKSAVSKQVARLEDRLGARLLNRTTRRSSLTEVGQAYYERCRRIVAEAEEAELAVTRLHAEPRGLLRVNMPLSFGLLHVADMLPDFARAYPEIDLDLTLDDRVVDVVDEGYDVVIRITEMPDSSLIARRLAPFKIATCASPAYWQAHGRPDRPAALSGHNCLLYGYLSSRNDWRFAGPSGPEHIRVSGSMTCNNGDVLRRAALGGIGVIRAPLFIVGDDLKAGRLESVLDDYAEDDRGIFAVYAHNRHLSAKVRTFVDYLTARFDGHPPWEP